MERRSSNQIASLREMAAAASPHDVPLAELLRSIYPTASPQHIAMVVSLVKGKLAVFETPANIVENVVLRMLGKLTPLADACELFLSICTAVAHLEEVHKVHIPDGSCVCCYGRVRLVYNNDHVISHSV